jgi:hypothetical protein
MQMKLIDVKKFLDHILLKSLSLVVGVSLSFFAILSLFSALVLLLAIRIKTINNPLQIIRSSETDTFLKNVVKLFTAENER